MKNRAPASARTGDHRFFAGGFAALAFVVCALVPWPAFAACSPGPYTRWTGDTSAVAAIASMPVFDTFFSPVSGKSRAYVTQGTQLFTFYNQNFPTGCNPVAGAGGLCAPNGAGNTCLRLRGCKLPPWSTAPPSPLQSSPNVVRLSRTGIPLPLKAFLSAGDGRLYKIDVTGDSPAEPTISADTRRPSCAGDQVIATPAVQLYASSNSTFKDEVDSYGPSHSQDDVVIVITKTGCGDLTRNRVIAYWASDLTVKWTFNGPALPGQETGPTRLGGSTGGCSLDYENNRLYCGTDAPDGSAQDTVWVLSTVNGALLWSDNPGGAVLNRPILNNHNKRLYVVSRSGSLWAYAPGGNGLSGPSRLWTTGLAVASSGAIVTHSPWVEERAGTWQDKILVLDSLGMLYAVSDNGEAGSILWVREPTDAAQWVSAPVVLPGASESKGFIGRDDGYLQMIKLDGGQVQGIIKVAALTTEDVYDPAIEQDPFAGQSLVVVGGKKIAGFAVPICTDAPGPAVNNCYDECFLPGEADGLSPPNWNPSCLDPDHSCWSYSCRNPAQNPQYNPCRALTGPETACHNSDYPSCFLGGDGCTDQGNVPDGRACDDGWPGSPDLVDGAVTCRSDTIPALAACTLAEGQDCNPQTGTSQPGSRFKCVTKPQVCGSIGGGKCCVCNDGFGMNCNDRCYRGQCVSDLYAGCAGGNSACIEAGDRACPPGTTCCGSNKGSSVCTTDAGCLASPQGKCVDVDPLDGNTTKFCYYQQCSDLGADPQHC
ncbi:MAG TPA: hypothetical protein VFB95_00065, partial [Candidatus Cryosericum sp.]|nr:hypothetical protein [Candidatus Cryosericum sp.]